MGDVDVDETLVSEIESYIQSIIESDDPVLDMSDSPLGSGGARCVAGLISYCKSLNDINLSQCDIKDAGAKCLFDELKVNKTVESINLSGNHLTDQCVANLLTLLQQNKQIKQVDLRGIQIQSKSIQSKMRELGDRIKF